MAVKNGDVDCKETVVYMLRLGCKFQSVCHEVECNLFQVTAVTVITKCSEKGSCTCYIYELSDVYVWVLYIEIVF